MGKIHEITESIEHDLNKKLRVGDTVPVRRRTVEILGKKELIASIQKSDSPHHSFYILERFLFLGMVTFAVLVLISSTTIFKKPNLI